MQEEIQTPDPPLSPEELALVAQLTESQVAAIDAALMSHATKHWRKVAMLVGLAMSEIPERKRGIPDLYYAQRIRHLVANGRLESDGNLEYMRFSEVRLPQQGSRA